MTNLIRSMTFSGKIPIKGLEYVHQDSKGRQVYYQPSTKHWFMFQKTVAGWVMSEYEGKCDC